MTCSPDPGLVAGLQKFSGSRVRRRGSSPKLVALNTVLTSAMSGRAFSATRERPDLWGRLVESAVGAHLLNSAAGTGTEGRYWRDGRDEVDYVVSSGSALVGLEVKSGSRSGGFRGLDRFRRENSHARTLITGPAGIPARRVSLRAR